MASPAYPYRRAGDNAVRADAWFLEHGGERRQLQAYVADWDYNTDLRLSCDVRVDADAVRRQTRLPDHAPLALTVGWFSTTTYLRDLVYRRDLEHEPVSETIHVELRGRRLAGTLVLETRIVLTTAVPRGETFAAHLPGSILWEKRDETRLQGDAPLFPISVVDFTRAAFPASAPWKLVVEGDVDSALLGAVRLYVNVANPIVVGAFRAAAPRPEDERVLSAAYADVARVFLEHALNDYDAVPEDPDPDSLGFAYKTLIANLFPGETADSLRERRNAHPSDFAADLLAKVRLFND
jgi:hypothetical protein